MFAFSAPYTPRRVNIDGAEAERGGEFRLAEGTTGILFTRPDNDGDAAILSLPPGTPHLSVWKLGRKDFVRLYYRTAPDFWSFDEVTKTATVYPHNVKPTGEGRWHKVSSPWGELRF